MSIRSRKTVCCCASVLVVLLTLLIPGLTLAQNTDPEPVDLAAVSSRLINDIIDLAIDALDDILSDLDRARTSLTEFETMASMAAERAAFEPFTCITPLTATYIAGFGASVVAPPLIDLPFDIVSYLADLGLKFCDPFLIQPADLKIEPNTADGCGYVARQDITREEQNFLFAFRTAPPVRAWGDLGTPFVQHFNTDVEVLVNHSGTFVDTAGNPVETSNHLRFPLGSHTLTWEAWSLVSALDLVFLYIPGVPSKWKYDEVIDLLVAIAVEAGIHGLGLSDLEIAQGIRHDNVVNTQLQQLDVLDLVPPTITASREHFVIEGLEPGGASLRNRLPDGRTARDLLRDALTISDPCRTLDELKLQVSNVFWPVNQTTPVTWTVLDPGPNREGGA